MITLMFVLKLKYDDSYHLTLLSYYFKSSQIEIISTSLVNKKSDTISFPFCSLFVTNTWIQIIVFNIF